jgi:hypothetical protein
MYLGRLNTEIGTGRAADVPAAPFSLSAGELLDDGLVDPPEHSSAWARSARSVPRCQAFAAGRIARAR